VEVILCLIEHNNYYTIYNNGMPEHTVLLVMHLPIQYNIINVTKII